ncbi:MAG: hypothetical protein Q7T55_09770, partial [Solirubrobacteraceae bacterium]|nr:hypothetical protein [Solirubrobacteraceae bacterium]
RIAFTSAMPYWGWDTATGGTYPTLGFLSRASTGTWKPDAARNVNALDIAKSSAESVCTSRPNAAGHSVGDCQMPAEFAQLPRSGHLAVTQYATGDGSRPSGRISVLDTAGRPLATYAYPKITLPTGATLTVHPRELDADPLGRTGDERFVVIFDAVANEGTPRQSLSPFAIQEFRYDARRGTIVPTSLPVLSGDTSGDGTPFGFETAAYDERGNLWVAQSQVGTLQAGPLAIYARGSGATSVLTRRAGCAVDAAWSGRGWGTACPPDERIAEAAPLGIGRSLLEDRGTGAMVLATMSGYLLPVAPVDAAATSHVALAPIDLGLDRLADRTVRAIGPRKGVIDDTSRTLWLPIQQLATPATCASWPCEPESLDQWLYGVDLKTVIGPVTPARAAAARRAKKAEKAEARRAKKADRAAARH